MADFAIKKGDLFPTLITTLEYDDGSPVDLTGYDALEFSMRWPDRPDTPIIGGAPTIIGDPENGVVEYVWKPGETDIPGVYQAKWRVTYPEGKETFPNNTYAEIRVFEDFE